MESRDRGKRLRENVVAIFLAFFIVTFNGLSFAGILGSPHDFSDTGQSYNRIPSIAPAGVCSGCHMPHGAQDFALWARSLAEERSKLKADGTTGPNYLGDPTLNCYDCHEHDSISNSLDNDPIKNDFNVSHRPPNIAFGMKGGTPGNGDWVSDPPGGEVAGYYENDPPNNSPNVDTTNYGVYSGAIPPDNTGGHYFKTADPATGSEFDQYDKLPCRDCHDPHNWDPNNFQAFIRRDLGGKTLTEAIASTNMSNPLPPGARSRDDFRSRQICTTCHSYSDAGTPVRFSDISPAYNNNSQIIKPPDTIAQHRSSDTTACTDCHFHNSIGASCRMCHGFPPSDGTQPYYPTTFVPDAYAPADDTHPKHVGQKSGAPQNSSSVYSFTCSECHYGSAPNNEGGLNYHQNDTLNVSFNPSGVSTKKGAITTASYTGGTSPEPNYTGGGGCQNVYCHSNGADTLVFQSPNWGVTTLGCNGCHGTSTTPGTREYGMPDYPNNNPDPNSHQIHVANYECSVCHFQTVSGTYSSGRTIKSSTHVNGVKDVVFDGTTASGSYNSTNKTCSVTCHGSATPQWGGTLANGCFDCHSGTEVGYKPQDDYGTAGTPNPVDMNEYLYSGHGRDSASGAYPGSGNPPAGFSNYAVGSTSDCYNCHDSNASHTTKDPADPFRLGVWAQNVDGLCLDCHGTSPTNPNAATKTTGIQTHSQAVFGSNANYSWPFTPKCVDCHDPHGDGSSGADRYFMIRSAVNYPASSSDTTAGSDAFGRPNDTTLDSITFDSTAGFATGSYAQPGTGTYGICEVCHNQTYTYNRTTDNAGNHTNRTTRCTTCHKHSAGFQGLGGPDIEQYFDGYSSTQNYDDQSHHPLTMSTDGTLTFPGVDNCISCHGAVDKQGGIQRYSNECVKCHFENQPNAPATNHMDGVLELADLSSKDAQGLPTAEFTITGISDYNNFCLQCHSGTPADSLGGITPSGIYLKDSFATDSNHMSVASVGCIYCHNPHGRTNVKLVRENPADRMAQGGTPQIFGVFPNENIPGTQNLPYRNRAYKADNTLANLPDADDANGFCNLACHSAQKERYLDRNNADGYYIYDFDKSNDGSIKRHLGGTLSEVKSDQHLHFNNEIISTDAMVDDYRSQPGANAGSPYYKYPGSTSADPSTYDPATAPLKLYPDYLDGNRDFDQNTDYGSSPIRYRYVCQTCHDVHGTTYPFDVRLDYLNSSDLCIQCHR